MPSVPPKPYLTDHDAPLPPHIRGLIFDCDGTLVDTMPVHFIAWSTTLEKHGLALNEQRFYEFAGMPTAKIVEILGNEQGVTVSPQQIALEKEQIYLQLIPGVKKIRRVVDIAQRELGQRSLAIASGGWKRIVTRSLQACNLLHLFPVLIGADDVTHGKPHPEVFLKAAAALGLQPHQCLVYEDGQLGFEAAQAAGMDYVDVRPWYLPGEANR